MIDQWHHAQEDEQEKTRQSFAALLASLYLVLLAFFIMLNAMSDFQATRKFETVSSLKAAFSSPRKTFSSASPATINAQDAQQIDDFYQELMKILSPLFDEANVKPILQADHIIMTIPTSFFFAPLQPHFRVERLALWHKLARFLEGQRQTLPFHVAFFVGKSREPAHIQQSRAAHWAQIMQEAGLEASILFPGMDPTLQHQVQLRLSLLQGLHFGTVRK